MTMLINSQSMFFLLFVLSETVDAVYEVNQCFDAMQDADEPPQIATGGLKATALDFLYVANWMRTTPAAISTLPADYHQRISAEIKALRKEDFLRMSESQLDYLSELVSQAREKAEAQ
jgi:hypothetical protein